MNNTAKKIVLAIGIGLILIYYFKKNNAAPIESTPTIDTDAVDVTGNDTAKKNEDFLAVNSECVILPDLLDVFNIIKGYVHYSPTSIYDVQMQTEFEAILAGTNHFYNENKDIRKAFLYDIVLSFTNALDTDTVPREYSYQYSAGLISLGDKGTDVKQLQQLINAIYANVEYTEKVEVNGTYDKSTLAMVQKIFAGTTALIDPQKGALAKEFVNNFITIINNLNVNLIKIV
jgi:hypothetical protein